jgi:hypothetical protein
MIKQSYFETTKHPHNLTLENIQIKESLVSPLPLQAFSAKQLNITHADRHTMPKSRFAFPLSLPTFILFIL